MENLERGTKTKKKKNFNFEHKDFEFDGDLRSIIREENEEGLLSSSSLFDIAKKRKKNETPIRDSELGFFKIVDFNALGDIRPNTQISETKSKEFGPYKRFINMGSIWKKLLQK